MVWKRLWYGVDDNRDLSVQTLRSPADPDSSSSAEHELRTLLYRVQALLKWPPGKLPIQVPRLHYARFANLVETMANVAEVYDRDFKNLTLFIAQNQAHGTYLLEQNRALAEREEDMELAQNALYSMKEADLRRGLANLEDLAEQLQVMNAEMEQARKDMEEGLRRFRNRQIARAVFSVFSAIAAVGLAIFTGGAAAKVALGGAKAAAAGVTQAAIAARRLENVLVVLEQIVTIVDTIYELRWLQDLVNMPISVDLEELPELPSEAAWNIFENEIEALAEEMPEEVSEVLVWKTKCKNMAALGRAVTMQAAAVHELRYDIETHRLLAEVARAHADRLRSLTFMDLTDYQRMATEMDTRTMRLSLALLKVLSLRNAAMLYQYLLPPTPLHVASASSLMTSIRSLLIHQEATAVTALNDLGIPIDHTVTFTMSEVPVQVLLDGEPWLFEIGVGPSAQLPAHWRRVRISHLQVRFTGSHLPTTDTGRLYILLESGITFFDRGRQREQYLQYEANVPVTYQHAYDLHTKSTTHSNQPAQEFAHHFMRMTPFTQWRLRLPITAVENEGLSFPTAVALDSTTGELTIVADATTQVSISFNVTAIRSKDEHAKINRAAKFVKRH